MNDQLEIKVNLDKLTNARFAVLDNWRRGSAPFADVLDVLNVVIVGGVDDVPFVRIREIVDAIAAALNEAIAPKGSS